MIFESTAGNFEIDGSDSINDIINLIGFKADTASHSGMESTAGYADIDFAAASGVTAGHVTGSAYHAVEFAAGDIQGYIAGVDSEIGLDAVTAVYPVECTAFDNQHAVSAAGCVKVAVTGIEVIAKDAILNNSDTSFQGGGISDFATGNNDRLRSSRLGRFDIGECVYTPQVTVIIEALAVFCIDIYNGGFEPEIAVGDSEFCIIPCCPQQCFIVVNDPAVVSAVEQQPSDLIKVGPVYGNGSRIGKFGECHS